MKAAVMYQKSALPQYADFPEPTVQHDDEILVSVKAVAIKHLDKSKAAGKHYSSEAPQAEGRIIGGDGVGLLPDGTRVYGIGISGMMAEKAIIEKDRIVKVPEGLDDAIAAALPNAVFGAAMALKFKANIQPGDVVLINGATGFTGHIAVQIAKYYGAGKVIVTGRSQQSLDDLLSLGADQAISLLQDNDNVRTQLKQLHSDTPIDVVIDYLWGSTAETILNAVKGDGSITNRIRYVSVGSMSGDSIQLSAAILRSVDIQLSGSGIGAWSAQQIRTMLHEILPEMFRLAVAGKLKTTVTTVKLQDIATIWDTDVPSGQRLVVTI